MAAANKRYIKPGPLNLITDVPGLLVGNADNEQLKSGVTVLTSAHPFAASVDVMGGAPGTRETECLAPDRLVEQIDALVLSGGSAFGLDAASGVCDALRSAGRGFAVGPVNVPIVPAAIIFDLLNGGDSDWRQNPYRQLGVSALETADSTFELGSVGAGAGATTGVLKGGLGSASLLMPDGTTVAALVVANPHGSAVVPGSKHFWAAPFEMGSEFGGLGTARSHDPAVLPENEKIRAYEAAQSSNSSPAASPRSAFSAAPLSPKGINTTIAIVATDAQLDTGQLKRLAIAAQDGMARALVPSHTPFDGDLIFSVSTGARALENKVSDTMHLGHAAAICLSRAIARGVYHASAHAGDTLPTWKALYDT